MLSVLDILDDFRQVLLRVEIMSTICRVGKLNINLQNQPFMMSLICRMVFASFRTQPTRMGR
jgi:hypothetical protein